MSVSLTSHWSQRRLSDVAELQLGKMLDKVKNVAGQSMPYLRNVNVRWGEIDTSDVYSMRFTEAESTRFSIRDGDLLVCEGGEPGRCAIWKGGRTNIKFQKAIHRIRPSSNVLPEWIALFLRHEALEDRLRNYFTGTTIKHLPAQALAAIPLPLPPIAEQRRIVGRIEALFARTRRARADLERIAPLSRRYIEQCRRRAFDEDATWPTAPIDRQFPNYTPPRRFDELRDLPQGWRWAEMSTLGEIVGGITKNQKRANQPLQMPYLRVANVYADELRLDEVTTIQVTGAELERVRLRRGDLLIVEGNGSVEQIGRVAVWNGSIENCGHQNHLIRVRPIDGVPSRFLLHWLMSPYGRSILETVASSSSGLHTLSLSKIAAVPVPVAPVVVADVVLETLDRRLHSTIAMKTDTTLALALLDRLEQSILARAFRGELVSPASGRSRRP
jgi:type I restriction enzyme S subunit